MRYPSFVYSVQHDIAKGNIRSVHFNDSSNEHDTHKPHSAIAVDSEYNWFYLGGSEASSSFFKDQLDSGWCQQMNSAQTVVIFSQNEHWDAVIEAEMKDILHPMERYAFTYKSSDEEQAAEITRQLAQLLPEGYELAKITPSLIQKSEGFDEKYIKRFWHTMDNYVQHGFGYCILHEGNSVCECISIAANPDCAEIDIHTASPYQRKGLAFLVAQAFIAESLHRGMQPRWDCNAANEASAGLARKLGFVPSLNYRMWIKS